ncbi:MAG: membrane protein [Cyclobacteriaceae bacterium]|nr:MAG: membrane protein [Cyclobacteriaceae bacterium]
MAFAQPFIPSKELEEQQEFAYIYLDNSLSMSNQVANDLSAFDQAIQKVEKILDLYPTEARFKLLTNDFSSPLRIFRSKEEILDMLTEIKPTGVQRSFEDIWQRLNYQASSATADWYFISDFQKATFKGIEHFSGDSVQNYVFVPQIFNNTANVFIDSVYLKNPFLIANDQNSIELRMRNTGSEPVTDLVVTLAIDDKQVANAGIDLPAHGEATTEINLNFPLEGNNPAKLSFEEFPVSFDNDFYFNLNLSQQVSVLEIKNVNESTAVSKVYGNKKLFDFRSYHINNLDYPSVDQADLVILNAVELTASLTDRLVAMINSGGNLLIVPSTNPNVSVLQRLAPFTAVKIHQDTSMVNLEAPSLQHPFFQDIFDDQKSDLISMPRVRNTITWSSQRGDNLLIGKNGVPYLSADFRGQVYLLGSPLKPDYSSLPQHAIFVPVMYKIAALSKAFDRKLYHTTDEQVIKIRLDSIGGNELFTMSNGDEEIVPNQRILGKELYLEVPSEVIRPGFYYLNAPTGPVEVISYNNNHQESLLEQYSVDELTQSLSGVNITILDENDFDQFTERILQARTGVPLWKYMVLLAILCLVAEVLLIRFLK